MPHFLAVAPPEYLLALGFLVGVIVSAYVAVGASAAATRRGRA